MPALPDLRRALQEVACPDAGAPSPSRRRALASLAGLLPLWAAAWPPEAAQADNSRKKKRRKRRKKRRKQQADPPANNAFGCLNVGQPCSGDSTRCCSGVCDGAAPKKGKPDTSLCVAHNVGTCQDNFDVCGGVPVPCSAGDLGGCLKTTGNAPFCGIGDTPCVPCARDTDCVARGFGIGAACIVCNFLCLEESGGTMCVAAGA